MSEKITKEMVDFFKERTDEHIERVKKNLFKIVNSNVHPFDNAILIDRAKTHDGSKYGKAERYYYIWLTEFHRCKNENISFEYPEGVEKEVEKASYHHITHNRHHPDYHKSPIDMIDEDIAEMVCDHNAMSEELNNSLKEWEKGFIKKWKFSNKQIDLIWKLVGLLEGKTILSERDLLCHT
jgi:hypothetical protein